MHSVVKHLASLRASLFLTGCGQETVQSKPEIHITGSTMGTYYSIKVADKRRSGCCQAGQAEVDVLLEAGQRSDVDLSPGFRAVTLQIQHKSNTPVVVSPRYRAGGDRGHSHYARAAGVGCHRRSSGQSGAFGPDARPTKVPSDELTSADPAEDGPWQSACDNLCRCRYPPKDIPDLYVDLRHCKGVWRDKVAEYLESQGRATIWWEIGGELRINGVNGRGIPGVSPSRSRPSTGSGVYRR